MTVHLVGAGPGDPGLLTVRAEELLRRADAVVHDRLVDERVLRLAGASAERHAVGKEPGSAVPQDEINELLVSLGRRFDCVVRLKGGDPYVFGRGGEEALALQSAGVAFEVVPGVSSVNGALAYAGVPVTHRGVAAAFTVVTGHAARDGSAVDWEALARLGGTIVVVMGVAQRAEIARRLVAGGMDPETPVAAVGRGTLPSQRTERTTLARLEDTSPETPALLVIGNVAAMDLGWFEQRPLLGWRVVVTRARAQASSLAEALAAAGALPVEVPTIEIRPPADGGDALRRALSDVAHFDWIAFTSANAVERVVAEVHDVRGLAGPRIAAIGRGTAEALAARGIVADLVPPVARGEELVAAFGPALTGAGGRPRVLLPQASAARDVLAAGLEAQGYDVRTVVAYETITAEISDRGRGEVRGADAVTFASGSSVRGLVDLVGVSGVPPVVATIGPVTTAAALEAGLTVQAEAAEATVAGLVDALVAYAAAHPVTGRG